MNKRNLTLVFHDAVIERFGPNGIPDDEIGELFVAAATMLSAYIAALPEPDRTRFLNQTIEQLRFMVARDGVRQ